uniref:Clathrin heavy chain n=1 Tax=Polytomella parva TaxID=51329 RepID=A0A7S0V4E8_9CHLO|mmetsp:Transcript_27639/g.51030  ORF Transcript_27639/g.51030 Transcript_27639/m.51030 type:complete len:1680 (+) Transcript_27639:128-5167(+)|eukprot:CAMPEP_0175084458 /NCGR_PEP_ID=MMETSP0052_2-20121109/28072_1 /TAXON_ID=51329 ORGANISM="Polytomella parva, Strain SAG 63-3" /NCGR_SAMPLE_ID=MMETSP0052_2 /ASSEMBLY_ACC=CAM_ASM_000194 /LENGTH=1679 /DNA_ID=CAMNT_0016356267 /DNA_START=77 /DNA_END=5116 /DNA_ORIENTATION=+
MASAPIYVNEKLQLSSVGVSAENITFKNVTLESDKYICVRETGAQNVLIIVDLANPGAPDRKPMNAESAIMCLDKNVIALKAKLPDSTNESLQVFNLTSKMKLKSFTMGEPVEFWKWITPSTLGLVTSNSVYHWNVEAEGDPVKVFDRAPNHQGSQIISYRLSPDSKWAVLIGITAGPPERPLLAKGIMQLYSFEQKKGQILDAHAAAFSLVKVAGREAQVICFAQKTLVNGQVVSKLHVVELGGAAGALKKNTDLFFPPEFGDDFPVSLQTSSKYGLIYVVTKMGLLFIYDLETTTPVYRTRISPDAIFLACGSDNSGGVLAVTRKGQVLDVRINDSTIIGYVNQLNQFELALSLARRASLPGAESLFAQQFERLFQQGKFPEAAELAAESPQGILRTPTVMERLRSAPVAAGQHPPILLYLGNLIKKSQLNSAESVELARLLVSSQKIALLSQWWEGGKLQASEELGDLASTGGDKDLALKIFQSCGASSKVIGALAEKGDIEQLLSFVSRGGQRPDFMFLLQSMMMTNPAGALALAKVLAKMSPPPLDVNAVADLFFQRQMIREATAYLLEALAANRPEQAALQTKLLEVNLVTDPQVADAILAAGSLTYYDRPRVAQLCEKAGLYLRALQHYTDLNDIKRVIINTHAMDPKALTEYFGTLSADWALSCLKELLTVGGAQNLPLAVAVAKEYTSQLGASKIVDLFESTGSFEGLFVYLGSRIASSEDPEEHFKYIEAAAKTNQIQEVERMTRETSLFPPDRVKTFLMEARLTDVRPLINVCDRFDMLGDLTTYLYSNNLLKYIEGYVQKVNPQKAPQVVAALLDVEAPDEFITNLILSVRSLLPVDKLVDEVEKRNRLKLLTPFLEHLISEGSKDPHVHNALGKIIIDTNNNPEHFLTSNPMYDSLVVGKYAERRDPNLACVAYRRGQCDDALVECTNKNSMFKLQARYIVERSDVDLWIKVLDPVNAHRRSLIDQVVGTALPESRNPDQVSCAVRAFMARELQSELIELLEKIVLQNSAFSGNANLQNLLILTAIKADRARVKDLINRLDNFDGMAVAEKALDSGLAEEAFEIYKKINRRVEAIKVLIDHIKDLERAEAFAAKADEVPVWSELGHAQLAAGRVAAAVASYLKASDSSKYLAVIEAAKSGNAYDELVNFLLMVRKKVKDAKVDTELVYAYAKIENLAALEEFIAGTHQAQLQSCGDRCFDEGLYESARVLFQYIPNYGRLASTLVRLKKFQNAVDAARKANHMKSWKEVCYACVEEKEFRLAQLCGLNIIVNAEELDEVSDFYQRKGCTNELLQLLESGVGLERAHMGIFTELGILYAKYRPEKLLEHLKIFSAKLNIPRLIRACDDQQLWRELVFLYTIYDEFDNAAICMMVHSTVAWEHVRFKDVAVKASGGDVLYRAVAFYLEEHPDLLTDLLNVLQSRVDNARVVEILRRSQQLPLIREYLISVQKSNSLEVNEALNQLLIEEEDFEGLRHSICTFDNFDQLGLAQALEHHDLLEFRRVAALVYKRNGKWRKAVNLAKVDKLYKDAMETTAASAERELASDLLAFFVEQGERECFAACLFVCYDLLSPDQVLEVAWLNGWTQIAMPYLIQVVKEYTGKVDLLVGERKDQQKEKEAVATQIKLQEAQKNAFATLMPLALPATNILSGPGAPGGGVGGGSGGAF